MSKSDAENLATVVITDLAPNGILLLNPENMMVNVRQVDMIARKPHKANPDYYLIKVAGTTYYTDIHGKEKLENSIDYIR